MHTYSVLSHLDGMCDGREKRKSDKAAARNKKAEDEKREKEEAAAAAAAQEAVAAEAAVEARKLRQVEKKAMQKQRSKLRTLSAPLISSESPPPPLPTSQPQTYFLPAFSLMVSVLFVLLSRVAKAKHCRFLWLSLVVGTVCWVVHGVVQTAHGYNSPCIQLLGVPCL